MNKLWELFQNSLCAIPFALLAVAEANAQEITYLDVGSSYTELEQFGIDFETYDLSGRIELAFPKAFFNARFSYENTDSAILTSERSSLGVLGGYQLAPALLVYASLSTRETDDQYPVDYTLGLESKHGAYTYGFDIAGGESERDFSRIFAGYQASPDTEIAVSITHNTNFQTTDYAVVLDHQSDQIEIDAFWTGNDEGTGIFGRLAYQVSPQFRTLATLFAFDTPVNDTNSYSVGGGWQAAPDLWVDVTYQEAFSAGFPNTSAVGIAVRYSVGKQRLQIDRIGSVFVEAF